MLDGYFKKSTIKLSFSVGTMKKKRRTIQLRTFFKCRWLFACTIRFMLFHMF